MSRPFRVAIGMMQRDEDTRLEAWILYHAHLFGYEALYIFDNGSTSPVTLAVLQKYQAHGVRVDYNHPGTEGFHQKGFLMAQLFQQLEADPSIRFFIPLDCDELLVMYGEDNQLTAAPDAMYGALEALVGDPHILIMPDAYPNSLGRPGWFLAPYEHHKVFFTEGCVRGLAEGFHLAQSRKLNEERVTSLAILHFHYRPFADIVAQSRRKLSQYVDLSKPDALASYAGTANHVARYLTMQPAEYAALFPTEGGTHLPWFEPLCESLGIGETFLRTI
jgi:hypothetical protein